MLIESVDINNILSIEDAHVSFKDSGLVLVNGWNHDAGRANGAGKTAIFNAITFALYDKLPRKITATEILRRGSKSGHVCVSLRVGEDIYAVRRSRPKGVTFTKNGSTVDITQEEWENTLKLTYTQYLMIAYCAQGTSARFLSVNDADKKQFLLQLLNLEEFSSCKILADRKIKKLEEDDKLLISKVDAIDSKIAAYQESLIDENVYGHSIRIEQEKLLSLTDELIAAQGVLKPDLSKIQKLEDDILARKTEFTRTKMKREMLHDQYRKVNAKIRPFNKSDTCGSCGASLDTSAAKAAHQKEMENHTNDAFAIKLQIDACDLELADETKTVDLLAKVKEKKKDLSRTYEMASIKVLEVQSKMAIIKKGIEDLNLKLSSNAELDSKINALHDVRVKLVNTRSSITREIELYKTISALYSPTGAQAYILDSVVESFNERVGDYTGLLWSNLSYELTSYKENVKGDVTAKFSEKLMMDGKPISIGSLSGGELRALSLCVDFALISVVESQFGIRISPIVMDEPFDGLDNAGRELILGLLEKLSMSKQVIVIDHTSELTSAFSNILTVEKRNGISTICESK